MLTRLQPTHWGILFALSAAVLFSSKAIFIKQAYQLSPLIDATVLMALRMALALPFFFYMAWYFRSQRQAVNLKDWSTLIFSGLLGYYFASWLDFKGLMYISASLERIILFLYPTLTVLAARIFFKQTLSPKIIVALLLSYGGTVLAMIQEYQNQSIQEHFWLGASLVFASAVAFATYLLLSTQLIAKYGSWHFTGLVMSVACIGTLTHFFIESPPLLILAQLPSSAWVYALMLSIFVTVIPTSLLIQSIARLGAARSAMIASIGPILTLIMASLWLNEQLNLLQWVGCFLNIIGVAMISFGKNK